MVKISILYPHSPDATFDMEYYLRTHMPMSLERLRTHPGFVALSEIGRASCRERV